MGNLDDGRSTITDLDAIARLGTLTETIHAVVYFAPEPLAAYEELGLRGYWRGYFASRAAPLGPVGPELVTALFGGFAPAMVARSIPEVWTIAQPELVSRVRLSAAVAALRRRLGSDYDALVVAATKLTSRCVMTLPLSDRPMAAALSGLERPTEPLAALWFDCSVLREHRGDGHLAAVTSAGLVWPEPHLLPGKSVDPRLQEFRGWDDEIWNAAKLRMRDFSARPLEDATNELAAVAYVSLSAEERNDLIELLEPIASVISSELPYPNAMGLSPL